MMQTDGRSLSTPQARKTSPNSLKGLLKRFAPPFVFRVLVGLYLAPQTIRQRAATMWRYPSYLGTWLFADTRVGAYLSHRLSQLLNYKELQQRRAAMVEATAKADHRIDPQAGHLLVDWSSDTFVGGAVKRAREIVARTDWEAVAGGHAKSFLLQADVDLDDPENKAVLALCEHPILVGPIAAYLGSYPVLVHARVMYSPNTHSVAEQSQDFHLDHGDYRQVKAFIAVEDIDANTGPFTLMPASASRRVYQSLGKVGLSSQRNQKIADDKFDAAKAAAGIPAAKAVPMVGRAGTTCLVDTCSCYHFGSRPAERPRFILLLQYQSAFSMQLPFWNRTPRKIAGNDKSQLLRGLSHRVA